MLKNNKNLNDNEDLIKFVALTNEGLFRELHNRKNEFSLIDTSLFNSNNKAIAKRIFDMKEYYDKLSSIQSNLLKIKAA